MIAGIQNAIHTILNFEFLISKKRYSLSFITFFSLPILGIFFSSILIFFLHFLNF